MSARDDYPILAGYADHEMPLGYEVKRALEEIDQLRSEATLQINARRVTP